SLANNILAHQFPEQVNSQTYTHQLTSTIDWTAADPANQEFIHSLNSFIYWRHLSQAYRYTNNGSYVTEMVNELASWSAAYPTMALPASWSALDQKSWLLDMGIRTEFWVWSYYQVLGSTQWSKEANTLFLYKLEQQGEYLAGATTYGFADN